METVSTVEAAQVHRKAAELGRWVLRMTAAAGSGHPSSALSIGHLVTHLMYREMRFDPANPWDLNSDRLVLSEGHAVPIVYAAWADLGGVVGTPSAPRELTLDDLDTLRATESVLDGHPNPAEGFPFFDSATGSLGMGLSVAAGLGLAAGLDGSPRRIFVIVGDGESREGQIWEAADFIVDRGLNNICAIFNCNGEGQAGAVSPQQLVERLEAKLRAFGWQTVVIDGHEPVQIEGALRRMGTGGPLAVLAKTVKGYGVPKLLDGNWHGKPLKLSEVEAASSALDRIIAEHADAPSLVRSEAARPAQATHAAPRGPLPGEFWPDFETALRAAGLQSFLDKKEIGTRRAYGAALRCAGAIYPNVACLDGDVSNSTFSEMFAAAYPDRFFECKIAEQNMVSVAAGLSAAGFIPFVNSFAKFIARAYDQVEMANISRANVKLVGSHSGISLAADGPSQMGLLDVGYFAGFTTARADDRESPLLWYFQPSDAVSAFACTRLMIDLPGMAYMRTHRPDVPLLYAPDTAFAPRGFHVLSGGEDLALIASGYMVHVAREAAQALAAQNIRAAVIDAYSLPIDGPRLIDALQRCGRAALVVEDNYGAALGALIAQIAARSASFRCANLTAQRVPKSTRTPQEALTYAGVGAEQIADHAIAFLHS